MSRPTPSSSNSDNPDPPTATLCVLGLLILVFLAQLQAVPSGSGAEFTVPNLVAAGALNADLVWIGGDWWRLATAPLLHGGFAHLLLNGIALFFAGRFLERHQDGPTMLGLLAVGALAGSVCSLLLGGDAQVSMGASGGIMGLLAGALVLCYLEPEQADTARAKSLFARILVPSLIPISSGVDYAAHFGGAVAGAAITAVLAKYDVFEQRHTLRRTAGGIAATLFGAAALYGGFQLIANGPAYDPEALVLRGDVTQTILDDTDQQARDRVAKFPADPQAQLGLAVALARADRIAEANQAAMRGLRLARTYGFTRYEDVVIPELKAVLALTEAASGRSASARSLIDPVCAQLPQDFRTRVLNRPEAVSLCAAR